MDQAELNKIRKLKPLDPEEVLRKLRQLELSNDWQNLKAPEVHLRGNALKGVRECRIAALFCCGMSQRTGFRIQLYQHEESEYDFIATWLMGDTRHIVPVQIKELVPEHLNSEITLQKIIDDLGKNYSSPDLHAVIFLNRNGKVDFSEINLSALNIAGLWLISCTSHDQSDWRLDGNFIAAPETTHFKYPA